MKQSDQAVVEKARRLVIAKHKLRWIMLGYAAVFLGLTGYFTILGIKKIEALEQLSLGFIYGLTLAVVWTSFGILGGVCLGKFIIGLNKDFRVEELLVQYHDRLRDLGQLPDEKNIEPDHSTSGIKPAARL